MPRLFSYLLLVAILVVSISAVGQAHYVITNDDNHSANTSTFYALGGTGCGGRGGGFGGAGVQVCVSPAGAGHPGVGGSPRHGGTGGYGDQVASRGFRSRLGNAPAASR